MVHSSEPVIITATTHKPDRFPINEIKNQNRVSEKPLPLEVIVSKLFLFSMNLLLLGKKTSDLLQKNSELMTFFSTKTLSA